MIVNKNSPSYKDLKILEEKQVVLEERNIDFSNIIVNKPWGYEYLLFENNDVAIWVLYIKPHCKTSLHAHINKDTSLICLSGEVICKTLENENCFKELDGIYLGKKVFHQTLNIQNEEAIVLEIESPVNKFDLVRFKDEYGRKDIGYENSKSYINKKSLTFKNLNSEVKRIFNKVIIEIGLAKNKKEFLEICKNKDNEMIITILNRNIWSKFGQKVFNVGEVILYSDEILKGSEINDSFVYFILKKDLN